MVFSKNLKDLEKHTRALNLILLLSYRLNLNYFIFYGRYLKRKKLVKNNHKS